ncbi:hypothetical protein OHA79_38300 [Streptomyces sp. NBC_00841]|uniref:hypothetical protein n=1 Tax=unclassified Streptomyces TaxID=2593676 RepID=UPI00224DE65B|nr:MULTISPECIES: hypothetical protein [unclassified Streptomyces]MCX4531247.1 hypothetical protein [Streptomyces sp. NBC_01669]WSA03167.1 hypothetical protein OHA79_38300 [Streptomyces sp. NBC_00841]
MPLATEVWAYLAFPRETSPIPASGTLPDGVLRDDYPLPPHPMYTLRPDKQVFLNTPARLPAVRQPWLRDLYDRVRKERNTFLGQCRDRQALPVTALGNSARRPP